ncbi:MFS transporter [Sphingomonas sp. AP4-R1]|uniref:MFS transporter n=1 Tax=Sphingomonas sp. AP4-R1 TaxID=2735134 RepID=UPI0020A406D1|nr:MFS transporter [Sphingomonas sp. AP4-R1]
MSLFQIVAVLMIALSVILDGLDNQMLGLAAPSLIREWGFAKEVLGVIFALGFVGMGVGTLASGWLGDRYGRRVALLFGVITFGIATILTGLATSVAQIAILKTLAGVGLGGIPGTAAAMIAEFTPSRWRSLAVTFGAVCVSIGGVLGGIAAAFILPPFGWRALFYLGGAITLVFALLFWFFLPESPRYLAVTSGRTAELAEMLRRMGHEDPDLALTERCEQPSPDRAPSSLLFKGSLLRDSLALSAAMLAGMFMIYLMFNWAPTLLSGLGFGLPTASLGLTSFNLGGTIGALIAATIILRMGSRGPLIFMALVGTGICVFLAALPIVGGQNETPLLAALCGLGLFASAAQSAMFSVGAHAFPTAVRARGLGLMGAAGRVGAILSALLGAALLGGGNASFFGILAILMFVNAMAFVAVRNHVPSRLPPALLREIPA